MARTSVPFARLAALTLPLTIALPALAGLPKAIDRVPTDATVVISIRSIAELKSDLDALGNVLPPLKAALSQGPIDMVLNMPGIDTSGSVAAAVVGPDLNFDAEQPPMVLVVPVTNAEQFMQGLGATAQGNLYTADIDGEAAYFKDLGGGFVAMSPMQDLITGFDGKAGKGDAHAKRLGKTGSSLADTADILVFADLAKLKPMIDEAVKEAKQNMEMVAAMAGPQAAQMEQSMAMITALTDRLTNDGDLGIMATTLSANGIAFDAGAQFKDGTQTFKMLQSGGEASKPLSRVPNIPYLFAFSADTSSPALKQAMIDMQKLQAQGMGGMTPGFSEDLLKKLDGIAFVLGNSPALMGGGLFSNAVTYMQTSDPKGVMAATKDAFSAMSGQSSGGMKIDSSYQAGTDTISGTSIDTWSMRMSVDPNDPNAYQAQQAMQAMFMIWGPAGGPSGYLAPAKNGVVQTLSKNKLLVEKTLEVAGSGNGLATDAGIKTVAENLPDDRSMELYLGVGEMLKAAGGMMAMMGMPAQFNIPENLAPVAVGVTTNDGAARARLYIPNQVITTVMGVAAQMQGGGMEMEDDDMDDEGGAKPRF